MQNHLRGKKDALHVSYVNPTACGALTATVLAERREAEQLKAAEQQRQQQAARQRQQEVERQRQMEAERQRQEKEAEIRRQQEAETRLMEQAQAALDALPVRRGDLALGRKQADLCNWAKAQLEAGVSPNALLKMRSHGKGAPHRPCPSLSTLRQAGLSVEHAISAGFTLSELARWDAGYGLVELNQTFSVADLASVTDCYSRCCFSLDALKTAFEPTKWIEKDDPFGYSTNGALKDVGFTVGECKGLGLDACMRAGFSAAECVAAGFNSSEAAQLFSTQNSLPPSRMRSDDLHRHMHGRWRCYAFDHYEVHSGCPCKVPFELTFDGGTGRGTIAPVPSSLSHWAALNAGRTDLAGGALHRHMVDYGDLLLAGSVSFSKNARENIGGREYKYPDALILMGPAQMECQELAEGETIQLTVNEAVPGFTFTVPRGSGYVEMTTGECDLLLNLPVGGHFEADLTCLLRRVPEPAPAVVASPVAQEAVAASGKAAGKAPASGKATKAASRKRPPADELERAAAKARAIEEYHEKIDCMQMTAMMSTECTASTSAAAAAAAAASHDDVPSHFLCPITADIMADPVVTADGHSYERRAIMAWLEKNDTSPITNEPLEHKTVVPNHALRSQILELPEEVRQA